MKLKQDKKGMILVLTMIMMAVLLSTAIGFSFFVISDINQAKAIDDSIVAYYAADAGMERVLYAVMKHQAFESMETLKSDSKNAEGFLSESHGNWNVINSTDYERLFFRQRLYNGQSAKFYVFNRRSAEGKPKSLLVNWKKGENLNGAPSMANLQISMTQLSPQIKDLGEGAGDGVLIYYTDTNEVELSDSYNNGKGFVCYDFKDSSLEGGSSADFFDYMVEMKTLGDSRLDYIDQISVNVYDHDCGTYYSDKKAYADSLNLRGISNLTVRSEGFFGKAKQSIIAHLPPRNLASGLLGFVLFSEQDITKDSE